MDGWSLQRCGLFFEPVDTRGYCRLAQLDKKTHNQRRSIWMICNLVIFGVCPSLPCSPGTCKAIAQRTFRPKLQVHQIHVVTQWLGLVWSSLACLFNTSNGRNLGSRSRSHPTRASTSSYFCTVFLVHQSLQTPLTYAFMRRPAPPSHPPENSTDQRKTSKLLGIFQWTAAFFARG